MADNQKQAIEISIPLEVTETINENSISAPQTGSASTAEMPSVTKLLRRPRPGNAPAFDPGFSAAGSETSAAQGSPEIEVAAPLDVAAEVTADADSPAVVAPARRRAAKVVTAPQDEVFQMEPMEIPTTVASQAGEPPIFRGTLILEKLDLKQFQKMLRKHKKCGDMKKLDCLGYFSACFTEIAYFEVVQAGSLQGVLGFGNPTLVTNIMQQTITPQQLPSIFELLAQGEIFGGPLESLRAEDQAGLAHLGFSANISVGAFPVTYKKAVTGLWICTGASNIELTPKDLKTLKKTLTNLVF